MNKVVPLVAVADSPPNHCPVFPQLDHDHHKGYFLLARIELPSPFGGEPTVHDHYLSVEAGQQICRDYAEELGIVSREAHALALVELEALRTKVEDLERENSRFEDAFTAIDVLESNDFRARRKAGRKPTQKAA